MRLASDPSLSELRQAVAILMSELSRHLEGIAALPAGPTSYVCLADLNEPVCRALARWDQAVFTHTETFPVAVDDGFSEDYTD